MFNRVNAQQLTLVLLLVAVLIIPSSGNALHSGVGGEQINTIDGSVIPDVAEMGCLCHNMDGPNNSVTVLVDDVPYRYAPGETYEMLLQLIGDPPMGGTYSGGFSMLVNLGTLAAGSGDEANVQNWEDNESTLTHTDLGADNNRKWKIAWTAPPIDSGTVVFRITGNSVNGDMAPTDADLWNHLSFAIIEGDSETDDGRTRTIFIGDGNVQPPVSEDHHVSLHDMGAKFRAHWLGLLGFGAVIAVIIFCGIMLRYGFSTSYKGRTNLLRLRYKQMRRGDQ